jgi:hypothetical protein
LFLQIEIVLGKSEKFDELMAAAAEEREVEEANNRLRKSSSGKHLLLC